MTLLKLTAKWIYPVSSPPIKDGEIIIENQKIVAVRKKTNHDNTLYHIINLPNHILLPGLINCHTHLELCSLKGKIALQPSFIDWIYEVIRLKEGLKKKKTCPEVHQGIDELLRSGTTTIADISSLDTSFPALLNKKIRSIIFFEIVGFLKENKKEALLELTRRIVGRKEDTLIHFGLSPHSVYSVSDILFQSANKLARGKKWPVMTHAAETIEEKRFIASGKSELKKLLVSFNKWEETWQTPRVSVMSYLDSLGVCDNIILVHLNHINRSDIAIIKEKSAKVVFCPLSNKWFKRTKKHLLEKLINQGIKVGLGTDSYASNTHLNMFYEMQEVKRQFPALYSNKIIEMATIDGATVLSMDNLIGTLSIGKYADIIGINAGGIENSSQIADHISAHKGDVSLNIINGEIIYLPKIKL